MAPLLAGPDMARPRPAATGRGNLHPAKQRPEQKIDAAVALMMAVGRAMAEDTNEGDLTGCGKSHDRRALKVDSSPRWKRISPVSDPSGASLAEPAPNAGSISSKPSQVKRAPSGP